MSSGLAFPMVSMVAPTVAFPPPPPPVDAQALPHTGMLHTHGMGSHLSAHAGDAAQQLVHQAGDAALQALGSLSGVLLVGRAALLTTRALAAAAVRAGEEQRCLERQQALAATAAEQWRDAAFAAVRLNARRRALEARVARAAAGGGPGEAPPHPDLPPPLEPVGEQLGNLRQQLARYEKDLSRAEKQHAAREQQRLGAELRLDEDDDAWQDALRASRRRALDRFSEEHTAEAEERRMPQTAGRSPRPGLDAAEVRAAGAEILGGLDPYAVSEAAELAAGAVRHAVRRAAEDPRRARIHLNEARKYVRDANKDARLTREAQERAALHYDFLVYETPEGAEDLAPAPKAVELLRRTLDDAVPLTRDELELVERAVEERRCALETIYVRDQCATAVEELARRFGGPTEAGRPEGQAIRLDWTPAGWEPDHWLRATVADGELRVAAMYRDGPERTPEQRALDDARCAQTPERLAELQAIIKDMGLDIEFQVRTEGALPGIPGEGAVSLDDLDRGSTAPSPDTRGAGPLHKTVDGAERRREHR
ncbi:hypothetical protein [Streptomyces sp. NPDC093018]|uniref:hypothetical protein n=1 Tax=Streptomyces sp. NPDC093018 TaxID=3155067 RepID=UPI00342F814E